MLSGKSNLPSRSVSTEVEPAGPPLSNEVRRSTLSETLTQANSNVKIMDQHPGTYSFIFVFVFCTYQLFAYLLTYILNE